MNLTEPFMLYSGKAFLFILFAFTFMKIKTRIFFWEYVRLLYTLAYHKPLMIFILFVDLVMLSWIIAFYGDFLPVEKPTIYQFLTVLLITVAQPLVIYSVIRKNYYSSAQLKELLEINFSEQMIRIRGESFYMELEWEKMYQVKELNKWFLLYQNTLSAIIIPKRSFEENQQNEFKDLLTRIPNVPRSLKE